MSLGVLGFVGLSLVEFNVFQVHLVVVVVAVADVFLLVVSDMMVLLGLKSSGNNIESYCRASVFMIDRIYSKVKF